MKSKLLAVLPGLLLATCTSLTAQIVVYDNFATDLGYYLNETTTENGDQITLSTGGSTIIDSFTFEYWITPANYVGTEKVDIRFYSLDGGPISGTDPTPTPGTVLFDSGDIPLTDSGRVQKTLSGLNITVPETFVWSAQFSGGNIANGTVAGLTLYSPPTVGSGTYEFWQKNGDSWDLYYFDAFPTDFGARITVVPEPGGTAAVFLAAAAAAVAMVRWRGVKG